MKRIRSLFSLKLLIFLEDSVQAFGTALGTNEAAVAIPNYFQRSPKTGVWSFRRSVPMELRKELGKREFKRSLKTNDVRLAQRLALAWLDRTDKLFASCEHRPEDSPQALYEAARMWAHTQGFNPHVPSPRETDWGDAREAVADNVEDLIQEGKATELDEFKLDALRGELRRPAPTIKDAVELYLSERNGPTKERLEADRRSIEQMVRRYERYLLTSLRRNKRLADVTREDARKFRDFLLSD